MGEKASASQRRRLLLILKQWCVVVASGCFVASLQVFGYPDRYGPFGPGYKPSPVPLASCELVSESAAGSSGIRKESRRYRSNTPAKRPNQLTVAMQETTSGWTVAVLDAQGKTMMLAPMTNSMPSDHMEVFSCELNGDGRPDFIVNVWSGGAGLSASGSEAAILLSSKRGYRGTSFYLYDFGREDLVQFKSMGPVYLILNDLIGNNGEKTRDGRNHNFWVYELCRIDGDRFVLAPLDRLGFPKWIWFTSNPNHSETTQLTCDQKARLLVQRSSSRCLRTEGLRAVAELNAGQGAKLLFKKLKGCNRMVLIAYLGKPDQRHDHKEYLYYPERADGSFWLALVSFDEKNRVSKIVGEDILPAASESTR
jgi:hypothetical protein